MDVNLLIMADQVIIVEMKGRKHALIRMSYMTHSDGSEVGWGVQYDMNSNFPIQIVFNEEWKTENDAFDGLMKWIGPEGGANLVPTGDAK